MIRRTLGALAAVAAFTLPVAAFAQEPPEPEPEPAPPPIDAPPEAPPAAAPVAPPPAPAPGFGFAASTQAPPVVDTGQKPPADDAATKRKKLSWRGTILFWDNSASTETFGVGRDPQSRNPFYEMSLVFRPRYYFHDTDDETISVRGDVALVREFTNSDTTTRRGETTFTDAQLFGAYARELHEDGDYKTTFGARAPVLTFPTSKVSANNGRYFALGTQLSLEQVVPLRGREADSFQKLSGTVSAGYTHWFTDSNVPTNPGLDRIRMEPGGRAIPSDQLSGAAFAEHQASFGLLFELAITERVSWTNTFRWQPSWNYGLQSTEVSTPTGDVSVPGTDGHFGVVTLFESDISVQVFDEMSVGAGYNNLTLQVDPAGQRRNMLYSPDARFYLTVTAHLDAMYMSLTGADDDQAAKKSGTQVARVKR